VSDCCTPGGYRQVFSERSAEAAAKRYRRRGLDLTSRRIVDLLKQRGVKGATVLEVGGGIGAIQIELLKAGAARAVSVELTPTHEEVANRLLQELGLADRVERKVGDFAEDADTVERADIVVMNRVICCYPDMPKLAGAAADRTRRVLVMSFPRPAPWNRIALAVANFLLWISRRQFHIFLHAPRRIVATAESRGLRTVSDRSGLVWQVAAFERA
jgi:2-polyprenyl-3-methyl-5-hydroxy-6-metoxy-1,4-benzoquinol methylase